MENRQLGKTDLYVSPVTFGGNVFGWTIDERTSFDILDHFVGAGFNFIDTADVYSRWKPGNSGGESETIIGNWMKQHGRRKDVLIATKVGSDMGDGKKGLTTKYILAAAEDSLRRLQTDHIDLYQTHFDEESTPAEETLKAYDSLVTSGKVRWIGTSNMSPARIIQSLEASRQNNYVAYQTLQPHYNLYDREQFETEYEQLCIDHGLGVISYFSLASGFLTGKYRGRNDFGKSARGGGMEKFLNERGLKILEALDTISDRRNTSQAAVSLAWLMARPAITSPIASATHVEQLQSMKDAASLSLSREDIDYLDAASEWSGTSK